MIPEEARYLRRPMRYYALPMIIAFCVGDIGLMLFLKQRMSMKPSPGWREGVISNSNRAVVATDSELPSTPSLPPAHTKPYNNLDAIA